MTYYLGGIKCLGQAVIGNASQSQDDLKKLFNTILSDFCLAVFTLAMFSTISLAISRALSSLIYLPWPIEMILSVSPRPRWPRQVQSSDCCVSLLPTILLTNVASVNNPSEFSMNFKKY